MKFIDLTKLKVKAGKGGDGMIAFRREMYIPKGGPSGGDGGNGGSIIFVGDQGMNTLLDLRGKKEIVAIPGENGKPKDMHGKNGTNVYVKVPLGTIVKKASNQEIIGDIVKHNQQLVVAKGGIGGRGNAHFASPTNRTPKISENGTLGEQFEIICELKLLANVGLIGLPNAGKSTFLSSVSSAKPAIADYPFTTLNPQLGVVKYQDNTFVMADLPGLIAGASDGKGLGLQFLRHIERCQVLVHVIDISKEIDHYLVYKLINNELKKYNSEILNKPEIIVANKIDLIENDQIIKKLEQKLNKRVYPISALNQTNLNDLLKVIYEKTLLYKNVDSEIVEEKQHVLYKFESKKSKDLEIIVKKIAVNKWQVTNEIVAKIIQKNPLNTHQNMLLLQIKLKDIGVFDKLRSSGVKKDDEVEIYGYNMIWENE